MKKVFALFIIHCIFFKLYSQSTFGPDPGMEIPRIIPPTPNAAALEKFGAIPVDYSTGIPAISYPMWSWSRGKLSFNLGLSYHAGGHKVEDMASNVGLGWSLTGIGRVSRTVRGLRDDNVVYGYMYTPVLPQIVTYSYDGGYYYTSHFPSAQENYSQSLAITQLNSPYSDLVNQIAKGEIDAEQDIFSFSFNGYSGRFVIDKNRTIIPLENTNVKIEMICNPTDLLSDEAGMITSFKITDDNGIIYMFEQIEKQLSTTISTSQAIGGPPPQNAISGWLLTQVIDPTINEAITFNYTHTSSGTVSYETGWSQSQIFA